MTRKTLIAIIALPTIIALATLVFWTKEHPALFLHYLQQQKIINADKNQIKLPKFILFKNNYNFEYPAFFQRIEISGEEKIIRFNYEEENKPKVYLQITSRKPDDKKSDEKKLLERGWQKEQRQTNRLGETNIFFIDQNRTYPKNGTSCSLSYAFDIPFNSKKEIAFVLYNVSHDLDNCNIYDEPYYGYYINIFEKILSTSQSF